MNKKWLTTARLKLKFIAHQNGTYFFKIEKYNKCDGDINAIIESNRIFDIPDELPRPIRNIKALNIGIRTYNDSNQDLQRVVESLK